MRYAVTGATGFVGGELAHQLVEQGHDVVALVRSPDRASSLSSLGVRLVTGDLDDTGALDQLLHEVDGLFHVAGWYRLGGRDLSTGQRVNVEGTRNVLAAAERAGTGRVVYTSTLAVNSDTGGEVRDETHRHTGGHLSEYDRTKAAAHAIATELAGGGLPLVTVMPGGIYGPGDTSQTGELIRQVVSGRRPQVPSGGGQMMWAHVTDIARGHLLAMELGAPGESYMLAGDQASLAQLLQSTARIAGTRGPMLVPHAMIRIAEKVMTPVLRIAPVPSTYHPEALRASLATYLGTRDKAERDLHWHSRPLEEGLTETVAWLRGRGH
ncbi:NAD-dependent epimerase/dehydratase family protein [Ornithinimicrobium cavernae]|uniref:NAD-dependent epimerase/dehydratase family protein n=1 Tax=Ornithinimicrobium cavernae TaxID=2666047 RepID=UPI00137B32DA|nr:NAD-dependent epimerase/dehydratase family protein [Ornithinimicrobium cavernae]